MVNKIRRHLSTIILTILVLVLLINPNAKAWVLRQLLSTGIFNAHIDKGKSRGQGKDSTDFNYVANGHIQNTAALRGKVVFINFWASWCPPCRAEFPGIVKLYHQFKNKPNVVFLFVDEDDDPAAGRAYLNEQHYSLPNVARYGQVSPAVFKGTLPTTVILDKTGKIRLQHEGIASYNSESFIKQLETLRQE